MFVALHPHFPTVLPIGHLEMPTGTKAFVCAGHNKPRKILKEMGIPDHLTCFLRNLYTGQEAAIRTGHGTTDGFK